MKIGALIPIRMASERLPRKALKLICGRPVCYHLLDRVVASRHIETPKDIVICTTNDPQDDLLVKTIEDYGCSVFRGSRDDIVLRFADAMRAYDFDCVIQVDGDDPLSATEYMDKTMDELIENSKIDIVTVSGLPIGCASKSFTRDAMTKVENAYLSKKNDTGFIYFFTKSGVCNHREIICEIATHMHASARLTLDYPVDYEVFRRILEGVYLEGNVASHEKVIDFLIKNPDVAALNQHVEDDYWQRTKAKAVLTYIDKDGAEQEIIV